MFKYILIATMLFTFIKADSVVAKNQNTCPKPMPNAKCENANECLKPMPGVVCENKESTQKVKVVYVAVPMPKEKSTLDVKVARYLLPNDTETAFPVTVRRYSFEGDS